MIECRNCDVTMTFHKSKKLGSGKQTATGEHMHFGYAVCHYCLAKRLVPQKCELCGKRMTMIGVGSQRLEEELKLRFPGARIARVDSDSMQSGDYYRLLGDFSEGKIDILAGTQMLAKGLHFPNVTLVGVISADTALYLPDFRTNERTFSMICQVAGRAGRSLKKGTVLVQTFLPEQPAVRMALKNDYASFVAEELKHRKSCNLPPIWRMARIILRDEKFERLEAACAAMREKIDSLVKQFGFEVVVRGPMAATISRIQKMHRMQILIQSAKAETVQRLFAELRKGKAIRPNVQVAIDVDPVNLL